jgi:hypothetical protein
MGKQAFNINRIMKMFKKNELLNEDDLSDEEKTRIRHKKVRVVRQNPEVLSDLPIQLFLRLVGLFYTIPAEVKKNPKYADNAKEFEELRQFIDTQLANGDGANFAKYEMADYVHNLHLLFVGVVQLDFLEANISNIREEYRGHVNDVTYNAFLTSEIHTYINKFCTDNRDKPDVDKTLYEDKIRLEYKNLVNENRKSRLFEEHIENTREFLMKSVAKTYFWVILIPLIIIIIYAGFIGYIEYYGSKGQLISFKDIYKFLNSAKINSEYLTNTWFNGLLGFVLLCLSAISGATGSLLSVLLRIQGVRDNNQLAQNIVAFKYSVNAIKLAPVTGLIFAIVLSLMFSANLIGGTLFPILKEYWANILFADNEMSKWLIWCFIAGFSERLVPDMVDKLSEKVKKAE